MRWALGFPGLSPAQALVLAALAARVNEKAECWPSLEKLSSDLGGRPISTVVRAIQALEKRGIIEVDRIGKGGRNRVNLYRIL